MREEEWDRLGSLNVEEVAGGFDMGHPREGGSLLKWEHLRIEEEERC